MQRSLLKKCTELNRKLFYLQSCRSLATVKEIFQNKSEFPTRHIGKLITCIKIRKIILSLFIFIILKRTS